MRKSRQAPEQADAIPPASGGDERIWQSPQPPSNSRGPPADALCVRRRLFDTLDHAVSKPLTWVWGGPGAGKTALIASYLDHRKRCHVWLRLDREDSDPKLFVAHLRDTVERCCPVRSHGAQPLHLAPGPSSEGRALRELFHLTPSDLALVLDDYHNLEQDSPVHAELAKLASELHGGASVIAVSRDQMPSQFARLLLNRQCSVVHPGLLALTREESIELSRLLGVGDQAAVEAAYCVSEGWVAGFLLLLAQDGALPAAQRSAVQLVDYFRSEVLDRIAPAARTSLLRTAFLTEIWEGNVEPLAPRQFLEMLDDLHRRHLFTCRSPTSHPGFRYHTLFRECLQELARRECSESELKEVVSWSASALEHDGHLDAAMQLLAKAGGVKALVRLLGNMSPFALGEVQRQRMMQWIPRVPRPDPESAPWLLYWGAALTMAENPGAARVDLGEAYVRFRACGDSLGQVLAAAAVIDSHLFEWSSLHEVERWVRVVDALLPQVVAFPDASTEAIVLASTLSGAACTRPGSPLAMQCEARLGALLNQGLAEPVQCLALLSLSMQMQWTSNCAGLRRLLPRLDALGQSPTLSPCHRARIAIAQSICLSCAAGRPDAAFEVLTQAADHASRASLPALAAHAEALRLSHLASHGRMVDLRALLNQFSARLDRLRPLDVARYWCCRSVASLREGRVRHALEEALSARQIADGADLPQLELLLRVLHAHVMLDMSQWEQVLELCEEARQIMLSAGLDRPHLDVSLIEAYLALQLGPPDEAHQRVAAALAIGRCAAATDLLLWLPHHTEPVLQFALARDIERTYVQELVTIHQLPAPGFDPAHWPWQVRIHALGAFQIEIGERSISEPGKAHHRPIVLLQSLIAAGAQDVSSSVLIENVWPDADGSSGQRIFAVNLHRLRRMLGTERALLLSEGRLSLDFRYAWVDSAVFEDTVDRIMQEARGADPGSHGPASIEKALQLYRGHFLDLEEERSWMLPTRQRLRSKLERAVLTVGEQHAKDGRLNAAIALYRCALERVGASEPLYRGLIKALGDVGEVAEAVRVYATCREMLHKTLGVGPSRETESLHQSILSKTR